jgi:ABC-type Fe3+-hydroxamate transport system substrate-binding protein
MKYFSILLIVAAAILSACGSAANNTGLVNNTSGNANLRGTNTNTGYVTNTDSNVKPTVPPNATNITPGNVTNGNRSNRNTNTNRPG